MFYYIADTHFGHENILKMCSRPYDSITEMNEDFIRRWNAQVHGDDTIFIVGDLFYRFHEPEAILQRLKGHKVLIEGNHDRSWLMDIDRPERYFEQITPYLEFSDGSNGLILCHYPLLSYKHARKNYMVHGHIHNDTSSDFWPLLVKRERVLNAGVDVNGYTPVTLEEMIENNMQFKAAHPGTVEQMLSKHISHHT